MRERLHRLRAGRGAQAPQPLRLPAGLREVLRDGPAPLAPAAGAGATLDVALVIPPFRRGSGGHSTIANLVRGLEALGHRCSLWLEDDEGRHAGAGESELTRLFVSFFGPVRAPVHAAFGDWPGADVTVATGWQTVPRVLGLSGSRARAYLVQDHEPEFYPTSAESTWAAWTYGTGLHCVCASPWLADVVRRLYGASATHFDLGVDHETYRPGAEQRRDDLVVFYARAVTPRRAVPLGVLALAELHARRPGVAIGLYGEAQELATPFPHDRLGILEPARLAALYRTATVGMVLSMTNPSLIPTEMLACGLPCVDVASDAMVETFGYDGPIELAPFDPLRLADALERMLDDPDERARRTTAGVELVAARTWERAAAQVDAGLRAALDLSGRGPTSGRSAGR